MKKNQKLLRKFSMFVATACLIALPSAIAETSTGELERLCVKEVNATKKVCVTSCNTIHKEAVGFCTAVHPVCRAACYKTLKECVKPLNNELRACTDACKPAFAEKRAACKTTCNCGPDCNKNQCFRECIKPALLDDFNCRLTCRDSWRLNQGIQDGLDACKQSHRECVALCKIL